MAASIQEFLDRQTWAVIGASLDTNKYGYKVYQQLKKAGYNVYPVNPKLESIEGDPCYPTLAALPEKPDAISVVVPPQVTEQVVNECINLGIKRVWMQPGSESPAAIRKGEENGVDVVYNQCVLIETRDKIK